MTVKEMGACRGNAVSLRLSSRMAASDNPDKAWLRRILTPRAAAPVLPAPERQQGPEPQTRAADTPPRSPAAPLLPSPVPLRKIPPEVIESLGPPATPAAPVPNVEFARGRVIKPSERLAALRSGLVTQAFDMSEGMPRDASAEARAELSGLWERIRGLGEEIETQQRGEDSEARITRQRGGEIER